jgi:VWFA-related protein
MSFHLSRVLGCASLFALGLSTYATAQQQPATGSGVATVKVSSRLTLVDVTVTDAKGHPVHALTKPEFAVKEDGKPQPIKNFEEFGTARPPAEPTEQLPPNVYTNQPVSPPTTQAVNILLFDQVATGISYGLQPNPQIIKYAKDASLNYLKTMPAGTQVAILETDGDGLHIRQGFTSDQELLLAAVNSIAFRPAPRSDWDPPNRAIRQCKEP